MANTEGFRLVRCPKCLNILPEPPNVTVYKCGGCDTILRVKIRASNGHRVAAKQVRQDSDSFSVATAVSNGVPPQNKDQGSISIGAVTESSFNADAPSTEHDSNGARSSENGDDMQAGQSAVAAEDTENMDSHNFEGQDSSSRMEDPADQTRLNANGTYLDSGETENHTVEQPMEKSETCRVSGHDDTECHLNTSENKMLSSEMTKAAVSVQDPEHKEAGESEHAANKKSHLVRVLSRSCDLRSSINSIDFHSARTSLQSKSFRASEPLQSKIMNTVDELKGDLSELFNKPAAADCKPKAHPPAPPRPSRQEDGRTTRAAMASSAPLAAYHPAAKHSGYVSRLSRSGQVPLPPRGLPSMRYRRHRVYPCHHNVQTEMRPCRHECCHSCQPPCYRSCKQEPAAPAMHRAPTMETRRGRPPPRNHCLPVLRGAPFVVCSSCASLVQLPTDFAVPRRGTRRLQCGSCSEVLSYSYRDPARKKRLLQSPFGGDEYSSTDEYEIRRHHQAAAAGGYNHNHHAGGGGFELDEQGDPVSYSEEYGLSFGVSHSTSTEDGQPLYVSRNSSFNTVVVDERMGRDGKLHWLMGYSSASELLRHSPDLFESFDRRTPPTAGTHVDRKGKGVCVAENNAADGAAKRSKARSGGGLPLHGNMGS